MSFAKPQFKNRYQNFIAGEWVNPMDGQYFTNVSPVDGQACCEIPRSDKKDVDRAVEAAWQAAKTWSKTAVAARSALLHKIADRLEANLERLAVAEAWDNGKAVRETLNADLPLAIDHFRYFGSVIRGEAGDVCDLDAETVSMEVHEPLGVVGQIIPWNFPILMAAWKLAPALAAGNCVVIKAASQTPVGILLDDGTDRRHPAAGDRQRGQWVRRGGRQTAGDAPRDQEGGLHGRNDHGPSHHAIRVGEHHSGDARAGRQIAEVFLESVMAADDDFLDKAVEGLVLFAFNQGEVCTCPSRIGPRADLRPVHGSLRQAGRGHQDGRSARPGHHDGRRASNDQYQKILDYIDIGKQEGAEVLTGGGPFQNPVYPDGFYIKPTLLKGDNKMRVFQEEIFGPVLSVTTFKDDAAVMDRDFVRALRLKSEENGPN